MNSYFQNKPVRQNPDNGNQRQNNTRMQYGIYAGIFLLTGLLGTSIGLGEKDLATSLKEFGIAAGILLVACLASYVFLRSFMKYHPVLKRSLNSTKKEECKKTLLWGVFWASLGFVSFSALMQGLNTAGVISPIFDQAHSRTYAKSLQNAFGWDALTFQTRSYEFGYMALALAALFIFSITCFYVIRIKNDVLSPNKEESRKKQAGKMLLGGTALFGLTFLSNFGFHWIAAHAGSVRPIAGTPYQNMDLKGNIWARIDSVLGISNPGQSTSALNQNWYSGHVSMVATAFWMALFCMILLQRKYNNPKEAKSSSWRTGLAVGWTITSLLFGATIMTAICRLGGLAHTANAVMSGFILSGATTLIPLLVFWSAYSYFTRDQSLSSVDNNSQNDIDDSFFGNTTSLLSTSTNGFVA